MATKPEPGTFALMAGKIAECLCATLAEAGTKTCYCGIMMGQQNGPLGLMQCGGDKACAVAWVRPVEVYQTDIFPTPVEPGTPTRNPRLAMQIEVGIARCYPQPQGKALFAAEADIWDSAVQVMDDVETMRKAILCCIPKNDPAWAKRLVALGSWTPLPAEGRVAGGTWSGFLG